MRIETAAVLNGPLTPCPEPQEHTGGPFEGGVEVGSSWCSGHLRESGPSSPQPLAQGPAPQSRTSWSGVSSICPLPTVMSVSTFFGGL